MTLIFPRRENQGHSRWLVMAEIVMWSACPHSSTEGSFLVLLVDSCDFHCAEMLQLTSEDLNFLMHICAMIQQYAMTFVFVTFLCHQNLFSLLLAVVLML